MNERIQQLAAAARHYTNDTVLHLERVHNRDYSFEEINEILDTKFAELIVLECNKIMANQYQGPIPQDVRHMMLVLQEHFGVEE